MYECEEQGGGDGQTDRLRVRNWWKNTTSEGGGGVVDSKVMKEEGGERDDRRDDGGLLARVLGRRGWDGVMSG